MKLDDEALAKVIGALRVGADMSMAARAVDVTRRALYKAMDRNAEFKAQVNEARDFADETIVKSLYDSARAGNVTAMIFWLKNRRPSEWRDRHEFAHEGTRGGPVEHRVVLDGGDALPPAAAGLSAADDAERGDG